MKTFSFSFSDINYRYDLTPCDSHKSFYGKAEVIVLKDGTRILRSYSTYVMVQDAMGNLYRTWQGWSATTGRHIKSFCGLNKKGIESLPTATCW
jgi:hypothetical protein